MKTAAASLIVVFVATFVAAGVHAQSADSVVHHYGDKVLRASLDAAGCIEQFQWTYGSGKTLDVGAKLRGVCGVSLDSVLLYTSAGWNLENPDAPQATLAWSFRLTKFERRDGAMPPVDCVRIALSEQGLEAVSLEGAVCPPP